MFKSVSVSPFSGHLRSAGNICPDCARGNETLTGGCTWWHSWINWRAQRVSVLTDNSINGLLSIISIVNFSILLSISVLKRGSSPPAWSSALIGYTDMYTEMSVRTKKCTRWHYIKSPNGLIHMISFLSS